MVPRLAPRAPRYSSPSDSHDAKSSSARTHTIGQAMTASTVASGGRPLRISVTSTRVQYVPAATIEEMAIGDSQRVDRNGPWANTAITSHSPSIPHHHGLAGRPMTRPVKWMALTAETVTRNPTAARSCPPNRGCISPSVHAAYEAPENEARTNQPYADRRRSDR